MGKDRKGGCAARGRDDRRSGRRGRREGRGVRTEIHKYNAGRSECRSCAGVRAMRQVRPSQSYPVSPVLRGGSNEGAQTRGR